MQNLTAGYVTAHGTKLHYYRTGGLKPPLVLVHGITDDGLCWTPVAEALAGRFDVVMVDLRGHGKSDAPETGYTLETLGVELAGAIQELDLEKPILLGHSLGAIATLVLAGLFPDLPRAILLEDPPAFWCFDGDSSRNSAVRSQLTGWIQANKRKTREDLLAEVRANPAWSAAELEPWVNSKHRYDPKVAALVIPSDIVTVDFPKLFRRILCPAVLISADPQYGAACGAEEIARLKEGIPHLQTVPVTGAGHNIRRDQYERYMAVVQRALEEL